MAKVKVGEWFGNWFVLGSAGRGLFWCRCSCGFEKGVLGGNLAAKGDGRDCTGHLARRRAANSVRYHPLYAIWHSMMARCYDKERKDYPRYGGSGVKVCERWHAFADFAADIVADLGPRPSDKHEVDRFPNKFGHYEPGNVRWATRSQNARYRTNNRFITANGQTKCIAEWAEITGISIQTIVQRIDKHGWSEQDAVTIPSRVGGRTPRRPMR